MTISDTLRDILTAAAQHPDRLAYPPARLPRGARQFVAKALLRQGLVDSALSSPQDAAAAWSVDGESVMPQKTAESLAPSSPDLAHTPATVQEGKVGHR